MLTLRGGWPGAARQVLPVVVLMVVAITTARPAAADIDLTGRWELVTTFPASAVEVDLHQFGSNLVMLFVVPGTPNYSGTIDPVTGAFSMSANGICGGSDTLIGTATSSTFTGTLAVHLFAGLGGCTLFVTAVTGARTLCGNGVVDAGEQCDGGVPAGAGTCCAAFSCQFKSDANPCSMAGPPPDGVCMAGACVASDNPGFPVNSFTLFAQLAPRVGSDGSGNFVVVWSDVNSYDPAGWEVLGQRFDRTTLPLGAPFRVSTVTLGFQDAPAISVEPLGDFLVTWRDQRDGDRGGIFARLFDGTAQPLGGDFQVNTYTLAQQDVPATARHPSGRTLVVWQSGVSYEAAGQDASAGGIFAQLLDDDASRLGSELMVNTYTLGHQDRPEVAVDGDGRFVVTWTSGPGPAAPVAQDGDGPGVFAKRFASNGAPIGGEFQVNTVTVGAQERSAVAAAPTGELLLVWIEGAVVRARFFDANATPHGAELTVGDNFAFNSRVAAAADSAGNFAVVRTATDGSNSGIFARRFAPNGTSIGGDFQVNTYTVGIQEKPSVAADVPGGFVVVWESYEQDGSSSGIFGKRYSAPPGIDHFQCYKAADLKQPKFEAVTLSLSDQFLTTTSTARRPLFLCNPTAKNGEAMLDPTAHLTCYRITDDVDIPAGQRPRVEATDQFGTVQLELKSASVLCAPSAKTVVP